MNALRPITKTVETNGDNLYYNVNIFNEDEPIGKLAKFSENRVTPILTDPSLYEFATVRFSVPSIKIPLLFFKDNFYFIKLRDTVSGTEVQKFLVYTPNSVPSLNLYANIGKQPIFDYSEMTVALNNALSDAFDDLLIAEPAIPATEAPFFTYDAPSELFSLNAEKVGYDDEVVGTVEIILSATIFSLYTNLQDFFLTATETKLRVYDTFNNSTTFNAKDYYEMQQSQPSLELFAEISKVQLLSSSIPVRQELQGTQKDIKERVLTDFNISGTPDKGVISFFPQGPLRYYDLLSNYPMKQIDCQFRWVSKSGESFEIFIPEGESATAKFQMRLKLEHRLELDE